MRSAAILASAMCAALLAGCAGSSVPPWLFGTAPDPITQMFMKKESKSLTGTIDLTTDPPGAQATTSLGGPGCLTPCSLEVDAEGPFMVTFRRQDYAPSTVSIEIQPAQAGTSDPKFTPNPVVAQLTPLAPPPAPPAPPPKKKPPPKP